MALSRVVTSDGSPLSTLDGSPIYVTIPDPGIPSGCLIPVAPPARPQARLAPPPNPVMPLQFSPAGLSETPIVGRALEAATLPHPDATVPTAYTPLDRLSIVATALSGYVIPATGTPGDKAYVALALVAEALATFGDVVGYVRWEGTGVPPDDLTAVRTLDGIRVWANAIMYTDGAVYWVLGGLGGYGVEPYWRFGGLVDPELYVPYP